MPAPTISTSKCSVAAGEGRDGAVVAVADIGAGSLSGSLFDGRRSYQMVASALVPRNFPVRLPCLLDVQANWLSDLPTRVVVPLIRTDDFGRPITRLHPVFTIEGERVVMATHLTAALRRNDLGTAMASLSAERDAIIGAIDVLWSGA